MEHTAQAFPITRPPEKRTQVPLVPWPLQVPQVPTHTQAGALGACAKTYCPEDETEGGTGWGGGEGQVRKGLFEQKH